MLSRRLLRIKAIKAVYSHFKSESESLITSEKNMMRSIDKTYELYHQVLSLIADIAIYAEGRIELGRNKKLPTKEDLNPNMKFIENAVIVQIRNSNTLTNFMQKHSLGWVNHPELIKGLYDSLIASQYYKEYMASPTRSYKEDMKLVENFFLNEAEDNELLETIIEEQSILWLDDLDFALIMVLRTLENCKANQQDIPLLPKYRSEDDREFVQELFRKTIVNYNEYLKYIDQYTKNWEVERIAFMDNLIMVSTMAELIAFPSIPIKVTLDEYIDIAKYYSTPNSGVFVNGIMDKVVEALSSEGRINKVGRGLMDGQ